MKAAFLLGRLIFGGFFIYNGINHFRMTAPMAQYAGAKGVPAPELGVTASGAALIVGGTSVVLGVKPKLGTLALIAFLAGVSPVMHDFWKHEDANQRQQEMINFMKNVAMLGAALALMGVDEPWPASIPLGRPSRADRVKRFARKVMAA